MRIKEQTVYNFDELSDDAKEQARQWFREGALDYDWYNFIYDDAATIAEGLGLDLRQKPVTLMSGKTRYDPCIYFSGFCSQGDGACFEGTFRPKADAVATVTSHAPQDEKLAGIAADVAEVHRLTKGLLVAVISHRSNYYHEHTMQFEFEYPDEDPEMPLPDDVKEIAEEQAAEAMRAFARWIYRSLEAEHDYQLADEQVDDSIRANEYEFTEAGKRA